jgi:hypothetical protein
VKMQSAAVFIVASFLIGLVLGWSIQQSRSAKSRALVGVVHEAEVASLCANALGTAEAGEGDATRKLLEMRLASAVRLASERLEAASLPDFPLPELVEGVSRARRYAVSQRMPDIVRNCDRVIEFLKRGDAQAFAERRRGETKELNPDEL